MIFKQKVCGVGRQNKKNHMFGGNQNHFTFPFGYIVPFWFFQFQFHWTMQIGFKKSTVLYIRTEG